MASIILEKICVIPHMPDSSNGCRRKRSLRTVREIDLKKKNEDKIGERTPGLGTGFDTNMICYLVQCILGLFHYWIYFSYL